MIVTSFVSDARMLATEAPRIIEEKTFTHLMVFSVLFKLVFFWLHFAGPRRVVGYWIGHEPIANQRELRL